MPKPVFMLCCETITVDDLTKLPSFIGVFNTLQITQGPVPGPLGGIPQAFIKIRISATWMRNDEDGGYDRYDYQFIVLPPGQEQVAPVFKSHFAFEGRFHRLDLTVQGHPFKDTGMYRIQCRIKRQNGGEWVSQEYPLCVEPGPASRPPAA